MQWRFSYARDIVGAPDDVVELYRSGTRGLRRRRARRVLRETRAGAANCGVVRCALHDAAGAELRRLDLVCQVTADEATGEQLKAAGATRRSVTSGGGHLSVSPYPRLLPPQRVDRHAGPLAQNSASAARIRSMTAAGSAPAVARMAASRGR